MDSAGLERTAFEINLRHAVAREQLEVHFQPLVDGRDGSLRGGEALLRWRHPDLGLIPFRRFLGAAREGGLLGELGDWVLRAACTHAAHWPADGMHAPLLTINVAIEQVMQGNLAERVQEALRDSGLAPERLELDFEEVVLKEEHSRIQSTLEKLDGMGVRLAIDDFGRGVSSIPRLKRYPLRALKLDPALVRDVGVREDAQAVVEAVACMANVLGLEVFARGVEGKAQQAFLCALDCHLQQGPLFGRPMSAEAFAAYVADPAKFTSAS
ncbi:EAL domain-containing protein [Pseudothauera nasutitermitis]|uniref:EAL domain-containing protein n=2 Tax=Pseudothauera nasutitermitis TaxID=2565930 RepID=A0A4S4B0E3_9RHOO|nr:EAL domain-containing protein [Pseudothauera nasutitermitis]